MADRNLYPHMKGRQAKQRIARERAEAAERERQFVERFEERQVERHASDLAASVNAKLTAEPSERVKAMIERDRQDRMREIERAAAEIELASGKTAYVKETVIEPTPEWFQHGDTEAFTPEVPDRTSIVLKSVRRVNCPMVLRMLRAGKLENEQYQALRFYAETYEMAGLHGNISIAQIGREVFGESHDKVMFTESQQQAQKALREMKSVIPKHQVRFFEAVVIGNTPVRRAAQFMRTRRDKALKALRNIADAIIPIAKNLGGVE